MSAASTRAPARANASALARPMPDAAAVTTAVLPASRLDSIGCSCGSGKNVFALGKGELRQQRIRGAAPLVIRARELADGPVAAPHHALRPEAFEQVIDCQGKLLRRKAVRLGDEAGEFADHGRVTRQRGDPLLPGIEVAARKRR